MSVRQLAEHVRLLRTQRGLTQEGLAELAGISRAYIGKIESQGRNLNWKTLEKLSLAFGMTPVEFMNASEVFTQLELEEVADDGTVTYSTAKLEKLPLVEQAKDGK